MVGVKDLGVDIIAYGRDKRLVLTGEVKNKKNTSPYWAARLRRNLLAHAHSIPNSDFFFVATPDRLYLWKDTSTELSAQPIEIDTQAIFALYLKRAGVAPESASSPAFELAVGAWLSDLARSEEMRERLGADVPSLVESGLLDAVKDGQIAYDTAA